MQTTYSELFCTQGLLKGVIQGRTLQWSRKLWEMRKIQAGFQRVSFSRFQPKPSWADLTCCNCCDTLSNSFLLLFLCHWCSSFLPSYPSTLFPCLSACLLLSFGYNNSSNNLEVTPVYARKAKPILSHILWHEWHPDNSRMKSKAHQQEQKCSMCHSSGYQHEYAVSRLELLWTCWFQEHLTSITGIQQAIGMGVGIGVTPAPSELTTTAQHLNDTPQTGSFLALRMGCNIIPYHWHSWLWGAIIN